MGSLWTDAFRGESLRREGHGAKDLMTHLDLSIVMRAHFGGGSPREKPRTSQSSSYALAATWA